jgi:hypothetical protein
LHQSGYFEGKVAYPDGIVPSAKLLLNSTVRRSNMLTAVSALIQAGTRAQDIQDVTKRLERIGLILSPGCGYVVFDKTDGGKLQSFFSKTVAAGSWRQQLADYAAFDGDLNLVTVKSFKKSKMASEHLKTISCRE